MPHYEETWYEKIKVRFRHEFGNEFIQNWKRCLDDCFVPWIKSWSELLELKDILNNLHADIIFTMEYSNKQQPFLDVKLSEWVQKLKLTYITYRPIVNNSYFLILVTPSI